MTVTLLAFPLDHSLSKLARSECYILVLLGRVTTDLQLKEDGDLDNEETVIRYLKKELLTPHVEVLNMIEKCVTREH